METMKEYYVNGKTVGELNHDRYVTHRNSRSHYFVKGQGYPISEQILQDLKNRECKEIVIIEHLSDNNVRTHKSLLSDWFKQAPFQMPGYDKQRCLPLHMLDGANMLIVDTETFTPSGTPDPEKDRLRVFGAIEVNTGTVYCITYKEKDKILSLLKRFQIIVTFNGDRYDIPILKREGLWQNGHLTIDLYQVLKKRAPLMNMQNMSLSLKNVAKHFKLSQQKGELDYSLLNQEEWDEHDWNLIRVYTERDLKTTLELYKTLYDFYKPFKPFLEEIDQKRFKWLTTTSGVYSYKVIAKIAGIKEEYNDQITEHEPYEGGYVSLPKGKEYHGKIYCLDFNSLYPHNYIQGNLYSNGCKCCKPEDRWQGNDLFPVKGKYCQRKQGKIEGAIQQLYNLRRSMKKQGMKEQYAIKIVLNTLYGISGNPVFKNVYNHDTAADCTLIGRESVKYARRMFEKAGYEAIYTDTDSVFIKDIYDDEERLLMVKDNIVKGIKKNLPFPADTFDMGVDERIKHLWFFGEDNHLKKKHYIYVNDEGIDTVKGLAFIKSDGTKIVKHLYKTVLRHNVRQGKLTMLEDELRNLMYDAIRNDIRLASRDFKVWDAKYYKMDSQLQKQIALKYGAGKHTLIPNDTCGVGKATKYCIVEDFKTKGLELHNINLTKAWNELKPFIKEERNEVLTAWTNA